jgi:hypothetical protein
MEPIRPPDRRGLRRFGLTVGIVLCALFGVLGPLLRHRIFPIWPWPPGIALCLLAIAWPSSLRVPHLVWTRLGQALGFVNSRIILTLVFFALITPVGLLLRLFGRNAMKPKPSSESYRVPSTPLPPERMKDPF